MRKRIPACLLALLAAVFFCLPIYASEDAPDPMALCLAGKAKLEAAQSLTMDTTVTLVFRSSGLEASQPMVSLSAVFFREPWRVRLSGTLDDFTIQDAYFLSNDTVRTLYIKAEDQWIKLTPDSVNGSSKTFTSFLPDSWAAYIDHLTDLSVADSLETWNGHEALRIDCQLSGEGILAIAEQYGLAQDQDEQEAKALIASANLPLPFSLLIDSQTGNILQMELVFDNYLALIAEAQGLSPESIPGMRICTAFDRYDEAPPFEVPEELYAL